MTSRIQENQLKALFFLILFFVLSIRILLADTPESVGTDHNLYAGIYRPAVSVTSESPGTERIEPSRTSGQATSIEFMLVAESPWNKRK